MILQVKDVDIASGGYYFAIINQEDAMKYDLFALDRIKITKASRSIIAVVDIAQSGKSVPKGKIGLFEEVLKDLKVKQGDSVKIAVMPNPDSVAYIRKKLDGQRLDEEETKEIIKDIVNNRLSQVEITFFISACYSNRLNLKETVNLTNAIVNTGEQLKINKKIVLDKHCSGGVPGNRTTMIIVPIIAAAGLTIPKTSSRSITSPAGTADTMEVLTNVTIPLPKMKKVVNTTNGCIVWGGSMSLASADDKMIKIRHPLSLDPTGLLLASIISKKKAVNATHVLIDLPIGHDTKIKSRTQANKLKKKFLSVCEKVGIKARVIFTDGSKPIGNGIGPMLEARDALWILKNDERAPHDLREKALFMAAQLLEMAGRKNPKETAIKMLESGKAYKKMIDIIHAQGGKIPHPDSFRYARYHYDVKSKRYGNIKSMNNRIISKIARIAGAPKDKAAGMYFYKHVGQKVKKDEVVVTIYSDNLEKLNHAVEFHDKNDWIIGI